MSGFDYEDELRPCTVAEILELANLDLSRWRGYTQLNDWPDTLTMRRTIALADFSAVQPKRWFCNKMHYLCPKMTQAEIAFRLGISPSLVSSYLQPFEIQEDIYNMKGGLHV